jgi:hypothetical protein
MMLLSGDDLLWYPTLSAELQGFVRAGYGVLMLLTLGAALPHARRYFLSERWGGYAQSSTMVDAIQNPLVWSVLLILWFTSAVCLVVGYAVMLAASFNLALSYYCFIRMRWRGVLRGMGAPGFLSFWLGAAVFLLELTARHAPGLRQLVLLTLQVDFAGIMLSAGFYKLSAGYRHSHGMELGMVNPEWGYWPSFWRSWRPDHPLFRVLDEMAWATEVVGGLLMLVPATRWLGGLAILGSFVFIATQIRLGFLCEMVMVCCVLFFGLDTPGERLLIAWLPSAQGQQLAGAALPSGVQAMLAACCWIYIALLPLVRIGLFYNQLRHRRLPRLIQRALDVYANLFGLIIWRVFTADVVNFFVRIWEERADATRRLVSDYRMTGPFRFSQVAECIAVTSVFTTLKYYPSNRALFVDRLLRYARTVPRGASSRLVFEWIGIAARPEQFDYVPVAEFTVDVAARRDTDTRLSDVNDVYQVPVFSPLHEGARPGSYAPLGS